MIAVVVPAFNEADGLRSLLPRLPACLLGVPVQVIVVSDGSTDRTEAVAVDHGAILVHLPSNRGKGAALRAGFARAVELDPSYLVTMDADGQHDPADLERLVWPVMAGRCALATGSRFLSDPSRGRTPLNRYLVRKILVAVLRVILGCAYTDPCCGYRCFSREALQAIRLEGDHYQSELEALFEAAAHGLTVAEVPVRREYFPGSSKMGARFGRPVGRMLVIVQYASTVVRKTRELRRAPAVARPSVSTSGPVKTEWGRRMNRNAETELLAELDELVRTDKLPEQGSEFFGRVSKVVDDFLTTGRFEIPLDPFRGRDREMALESDLYYVMFWRMFDRTPAAMLQDFAIKLRRILARRVFKRCGEDVVIHHNVLFNSGRNIELGDGVFLNRDVMLDDRAALTIGDHTMVAAGVVIETHRHVYDDFSVPLPHGGRVPSPVHIGSNTLIGYKVAVMAGVTIGNRCVVAANSVVTKDVPDLTIVGGVPAKVIKTIAPRALGSEL